jgi:hypothetical protein
MANPHRAECSLELDDRHYVLRLTLQALAEIEAGFAVDGLQALGARLSSSAISTADLVRIAGALIRGGGGVLSDQAVAAAIEARHIPAIVAAVSRVFALSFPEAADDPPNPP